MLVAAASAQEQPQASPSPAPTAAPDPAIYGQYPIAYQELVQRWLGTKLADPASSVIEWEGQPRAGEHKTQKGDKHVGYIVEFKVNARNQFGAYTGKQRYRVVLKNGEVLWGGRAIN